jgi:hypothetical protein
LQPRVAELLRVEGSATTADDIRAERRRK